MKLRARVRVTHEIKFEHDVPEPEWSLAGQRSGRETYSMTNEETLLDARSEAAREIDKRVLDRFPDAIDVLIEEVVEA